MDLISFLIFPSKRQYFPISFSVLSFQLFLLINWKLRSSFNSSSKGTRS